MSQGATTQKSPFMVLYSDKHKQSILSKFERLRKNNLLCDVTLVVEEVPFKAHKALLALSSNFFSVMFTSEDVNRSTYNLAGMTAQMFSTVLEFIYNAQVSVEEGVTDRLLATAALMEVSDLVKELTDLKRSAIGLTSEEAKKSNAEVLHMSKRKRRRPSKSVSVTEPQVERSAPCHSSEEAQVGNQDSDDAGSEMQPKDDADYPPGANRSRQSKRKIRPPVKYRSYKVASDATGSKEPGRRGRKRKYPNTDAQCEDCDRVFKNHLFLKIHQRTHTGSLSVTTSNIHLYTINSK